MNTSGSAVAELMRIAWRSVGAICERVAAEAGRDADLLAGLERIGIDEISHRKGHRYLTVVVDHDSGRLIWAAPGRDKATVEAFFDALGLEARQQLEARLLRHGGLDRGGAGEALPEGQALR